MTGLPSCRCFEGALAALAAPLVGILAQHVFGLHGTAAPTGDPSIDLPKARALGNALLILTAVPWTLCLLLYSGAGNLYVSMHTVCMITACGPHVASTRLVLAVIQVL